MAYDVAHFGDNVSSVTIDFYQFSLFFVIGTLILCLCLAVPGSLFLQRLKALLILLASLFFGASILVLQFSPQWETGRVVTELTLPIYNSDGNRINSSLGGDLNQSIVSLHLGLRGINVTFENKVNDGEGSFHFNERFQWAWDQGRNDFGPLAGSFQRQYREGQRSGLPTAILRVANVFTIDGEGIRYGRMYRTAGYHAHSLIWSAFLFWIVSMICFQFSLIPGAYFLALSGAMLLLANTVWASLSPALQSRPPVVLLGSAALRLQLGPAFYLCLLTGLLAVGLAVALLLFEKRNPMKAATFLGLDPRNAYDEYYCSVEELTERIPGSPRSPKKSAETKQLKKGFSLDAASSQERDSLVRGATVSGSTGIEQQREQILVFRRRNTPLSSSFFDRVLGSSITGAVLTRQDGIDDDTAV